MKKLLFLILSILCTFTVTFVIGLDPQSNIETTPDTEFQLAFTKQYPSTNNSLSVIQLEIPEGIEYISFIARYNQTSITEQFTQQWEQDTITLLHEATQATRGLLTVNITLKTDTTTETKTIAWRTVYTSLKTPTTPPEIEDNEGTILVQINEFETEQQNKESAIPLYPYHCLIGLTLTYLVIIRGGKK